MSAKLIDCKIISNTAVAADYYLMQLQIEDFAATPGQFVMVQIMGDTTDPLLRIPLGIHAINDNGISLLYRVVGQGTKLLSQKQAGETLNILGPLGNGFNITAHQNNILVAGACGIAPLYALAQKLIKNQNVTLFVGAATKAQIVTDEFKQLNIEIHVATEDDSAGYYGLVTDLAKQYLTDDIMVYACGPNGMLKALAEITNSLNIPAQLSLESYMSCGIGMCRGCAVNTKSGYKMCCKDGPVFAAEDLL